MIRYNVFNISRRRLIAFLSTAILFALMIWVANTLLPVKNVWNRFDTEKNIGTFFCEKTNMANLVRQPINTFSNFIYFITAVIVLRRGWRDHYEKKRYNIVSANPFYSFMLGAILLYIFCASVFFHSSLIHVAGNLDFSAVYSLSLFPLMYFSHRVLLLKLGVPSNLPHLTTTRIVVTAFTLAYLMLTFLVPEQNQLRNYVVLGIIMALAACALFVETHDRGKTNHYYLMACIAYIFLAVVCFAFDIKKVFCNPESIVQPHSLWHLFSGIALFYFYMYIRSEKNKI